MTNVLSILLPKFIRDRINASIIIILYFKRECMKYRRIKGKFQFYSVIYVDLMI